MLACLYIYIIILEDINVFLMEESHLLLKHMPYHYMLHMIIKKSFTWKLIIIRHNVIHLLQTIKFSPFHSDFSKNHNLCIQTMH